MNITKIIIVFLLILAIIILLNKKKISEYLLPSPPSTIQTRSAEAINNYLAMIDRQIDIKLQNNKIFEKKLLSDQVCDEQQHCLSFRKMLLVTNPINQYMYLPNENIMWNNLKTFKNITPGWTNSGEDLDTTYDTTTWYDKNIYKTKTVNNQPMGTGIKIKVPDFENRNDISGLDFSVLWVQTLNDTKRWSTFRVYTKNEDGTYNSFGSYGTGFRYLNNISPNGSIHNETYNLFEWYPVPIQLNSSREVYVSNPFNELTWYSGFAFSTNPWNHCRVSARTIYCNLNKEGNDLITTLTSYPTQTTIVWGGSWNNDTYCQITTGSEGAFRIPFVNSGREKIFYLIEHNDNWSTSSKNVKVNGIEIGNLYTSFDNPFARHFNSKIWQRYLGVIIPKDIINSINSNFMTITITTPFYINIREVGTHDVNPFD